MAKEGVCNLLESRMRGSWMALQSIRESGRGAWHRRVMQGMGLSRGRLATRFIRADLLCRVHYRIHETMECDDV